MGESITGEDLKNIDIEDWELIDENNERTYELLDRCACDINDMSANMNYIQQNAPSINASLSGLKTIDKFTIWEGVGSQAKFKALTNIMSEKTGSIVGLVELSRLNVGNFAEVSDSDYSLFAKIIMGAEKIGAFWIAKKAFENTPWGAALFMMAYGTDAFDGANFIEGDPAVAGLQALEAKYPNFFLRLFNLPTDAAKEFAKQMKLIWINTGIGTVCVFGLSLLGGALGHEGEWSDLDVKEVWTNAAVDAAMFFEWTTIVSVMEAAGSTGCLPVVVAAGVTLATSFLFKAIANAITGNYEIDTFKRDGKEYHIYANGVGHDGEWDDILRRFENEIPTHMIRGEPYSESTYYKMLYGSDWKEAVPESLEYIFPPGGGASTNILLDALRGISSPYEAQQLLLKYGISYDITTNSFSNVATSESIFNGNQAFLAAEDLNNMAYFLGFNLEDFLKYNLN